MVRSLFQKSGLAIATLWGGAIGHTGITRAQTEAGSGFARTRIVHNFDFDERKTGNLEDVPKFWEPLRPTGFPHFAYGVFDFEVGRLGPPSFHLGSEGRNIAYHYVGPETHVRANTDYRIEGYIRPQRLRHARACLSAHYLDKHGRPVPETLVRSRYVGGVDDGNEWSKVKLYLPAAPPEAYTIGLVAWVLQRPLWSDAVLFRRHIPRTDTLGGAWFDDLVIYALPRVQITTGADGNVLVPGGPQELHVLLADDDDPTLEGLLSIRAADGALVETHTVSVMLGTQLDAARISVEHLSPGLYHSRLEVFAGNTLIASRSLTFARLSKRLRGSEVLARPFGVVVTPQARSDPETELALLQNLAVKSAKLPVWSGMANDLSTAPQRRAKDRLRQGLVKSGFALVGVFYGPPNAIVRADGAYVRPLHELLSGDPAAWKEHLAAVVAPHSSTFRCWQIGPDSDGGWANSPGSNTQLVRAIAQLSDEMRPFITKPRLMVPVSTAVEPRGEKLPVMQVTLSIGSEIRPDWFAAQIRQYKDLGYGQVDAYIGMLPPDDYRRPPRLADWAQRIIAARHAGANTVYVPQPWRRRGTVIGPVTEPTEAYLILRTIADTLASSSPGQRLRVGGDVQCLAFHDGESTVLALWDPRAPLSGSRRAIQLGRADTQLDLWGRATPLERDESGRQILHLTPMPVLVPGVERWLIEFRTSLEFGPSHIESGVELMHHTVKMSYKGDRPVSGRVVLDVPESWEISPRNFTFSLMPQRVGSHPEEVHYPHNEPAGEKQIVAKVTLADASYYLEVPLSVEIGVTDLEVSGLAVVENDELVLRHVVTNRSSDVLSFRGSANVPGRERQYRPISNLQPSETQSVEYRFKRGRQLVGRSARLVLREVNDGPRIHNLKLAIP